MSTITSPPSKSVSRASGPVVSARPETAASESTAARTAVELDWLLGSACLYGGIGIFTLAVIDGIATLPFPMPDLWYGNRILCAFLSLVAIVLGTALVKREPRLDWRPTTSGRRFETVILYTRTGCHLCDDARDLLMRYSRWLPAPIEVDIDSDPELLERFTTCVPVVQFDGRVRFRGHVSELLLRRLIEGTPPESTRGGIAFKAGGCGTGCGCGPQAASDSAACGSGGCGSESCGTGGCGSEACGCGNSSCGCGRGGCA